MEDDNIADSNVRMEKAYGKFMEKSKFSDAIPDKDNVAQILSTIADRIIQATSYNFQHVEEGIEVNELPESPEITVKMRSGFNDWKYWNGVLNLAFLELSKTMADIKYETHVLQNYAFIFKTLPYFQHQYENGLKNGSLHQFLRMDRLDDSGAMDAGLIDVQKIAPNKVYEKRIIEASNYILNRQERLADGTFCRIYEGKTTVWADDAYMSIPFLVNMWSLSEEDKYLQEAVTMALNVNTHLFDVHKGLYYHCWYPDWDTHGVAFWGRANGWVIMALTELLLKIPDNHPSRNELLINLRKHLVGVSRYQHKDGLWHQLMDKQDSFLETSSSAMFIYGIATAVNEGWLDESYTPIAIKAWNALVEKIRPDGQVENVSLGFNLRADLPFYYTVPPVLDDPHGLGVVLYAGISIYKLKSFNPWVWE